jgi:hypothetical protein
MGGEVRKDSRVGQAAARLLSGLRRSQWLPHFDRSTLRDVVAEMGELFKHLHFNLDLNRVLSTSVQDSATRTAAITFLDTALRRNRQCVLAYLNYRLEALSDLVWNHLGRDEELPIGVKERLDQEEIKFVRQYEAVLNQYMGQLNGAGSSDEHFINILTDILPPVDVATEVEVIKGTSEYQVGTRFLARPSAVEPLILRGHARQLGSASS